MSAFDVAISLTQDQLNTATGVVYKRLYPKVFTGSKPVNQLGIKSVAWDMTTAPSFNLAPTKAALDTAEADLRATAESARAAFQPGDAGELDGVSLDAAQTFTLEMPAVKVTLFGDTEKVIQLKGVAAACQLDLDGDKISFVPLTVTADPLPDKTDEFFVKLVVLPELKQTLEQLFSGLTIPSFSLPGVPLSPPNLAILDGHIVAAANLVSKGVPGPISGQPWTGSPFSILLGNDALQASANGQGKNVHGGSHASEAGIEFKYSYSFDVGNPRVAISGSGLLIEFVAGGSVSASAKGWATFWQNVRIPFGVVFNPLPLVAECVLRPSGDKVNIVAQSARKFSLLLTPKGNFIQKIISGIGSAVVDPILAIANPDISAFLRGLNISSLSIPTYKEVIAGTEFVMSPTNLSPSNVGGYLALGGSLSIT